MEWKSTNGNTDVLDLKDGETLLELDQDKLGEKEVLSSCNTRKGSIQYKNLETSSQLQKLLIMW